ncbi:EAL domain-containing protein [Deinococcus pimensis]|uniref:EAL domain-containing protein n=1 Tax=Deinococcus pimensis TaxID=309888 RepID=UPI000A00D534|nr:EAL domain-containing protein [Deinococcus pimensis]
MPADLTPLPCDCHAVRPAPLPGALALRGRSTHVHRRLRLVLAALEVPTTEVDGALLLRPDHYDRLTDLAGALGPTEAADLLVAPCEDGLVDPWSAAPLATWLGRVRTPWFDEAARNLHAHLQPIVSLPDGSVYGYEALLRAHVDGRLISAGPLLEAASSRGQLRALDALARTVAITGAYPALPAGAHLFINFSPGVIYNPDVCLDVTWRACERAGADLGRLVFEVTESEAFPDLALLRRILERYRREGAQVALDDLGAGHTSLTYLEALRPDIVKLDRGLVRGLTAGDPRVDLVGALVRYAHGLGVRVVAEGIESAHELSLVRELGADYAQGFFIARPAPVPPPVPPVGVLFPARSAGTW